MIKGIVRISIFTLVLLLLVYVLRAYTNVEFVHYLVNWVVLFFWAQYIILHTLTEFLKNNIEIGAPLLSLGVIGARLITALFAFLAMVMLDMEGKVMFAVNFSVFYLLYQVFEIIAVLSNLRRNSR